MEKPIIGILGNTYKTQPGLFSSAERMYVNSDYIEGVLNNGGIPMAIPAVAMKADPEGLIHTAPEMNRLFADLVERSCRYREKR